MNVEHDALAQIRSRIDGLRKLTRRIASAAAAGDVDAMADGVVERHDRVESLHRLLQSCSPGLGDDERREIAGELADVDEQTTEALAVLGEMRRATREALAAVRENAAALKGHAAEFPRRKILDRTG